MSVRIIQGDCRDVLKTLPEQSVQCVVTSPPYFGLRNYNVDGQIGLEPTPAAFVAEMVAVFREVWRVLRDDGTLWLNLGDSYNAGRNGGHAGGVNSGFQSVDGRYVPRSGANVHGLKPKDLIGIPWRVAFALQDDGWYLRRDIIWAKPNPMPESCTDRPTTAHEYLFLLTKRPRYFYDAEAVREGRTSDEDAKEFRGGCYVGGETDNATMGKRKVVGNRKVKVPGGWDRGEGAHGTIHRDGRTSAEYQDVETKAGRNLRSVWTIATAPFSDAHFATFPPKLAETCILAGTSEKGACSSCGSPLARIVERTAMVIDRSERTHSMGRTRPSGTMIEPPTSKTAGWNPTCDCPLTDPVPCVVFDPFGGAGTVGLVADRLQRDAVLIELNPEYAEIAERRVHKDAGLFAEVFA